MILRIIIDKLQKIMYICYIIRLAIANLNLRYKTRRSGELRIHRYRKGTFEERKIFMKNWKKNPVRLIWLFVGFLSIGIGAVGVVLPVLPTTPFLLLASFCLAKGSARFHNWFTGTKLYKKHLDSFVKNRSMTLKTKFSLLIPVTCMLLLAFLAMQNVYGRIFIVLLIIFKYVYFFTKIRTVPAGQKFLPEAEG